MSIAYEQRLTETDQTGEFCTDDYADGRMDPAYARLNVAFVIVSLLALWGTVDLVLRAIAWWTS